MLWPYGRIVQCDLGCVAVHGRDDLWLGKLYIFGIQLYMVNPFEVNRGRFTLQEHHRHIPH